MPKVIIGRIEELEGHNVSLDATHEENVTGLRTSNIILELSPPGGACEMTIEISAYEAAELAAKLISMALETCSWTKKLIETGKNDD